MMLDHQGTPVRSDRIAVNGTRLHYRFAGAGSPVVLLHGVPKTSYHWRHLLPLLSFSYTVIAPDLRGLGNSDHPVGGYDTATMSGDIAELMMKLEHERYSVVGEDWGALVGYHVAAQNPEKVLALAFAEAPFPDFGFEEHTALTPANVSGLFLWHLGFYFQPDSRDVDLRSRTGTNHLYDQE